MKLRIYMLFLFCGVSVFSFVLLGCGPINKEVSTIDRRQYVENHPDLNEHNRLLILNGYIELGMSEEQVLATKGAPLKKIVRKSGNFDAIWVYRPHWKFLDYLYFKKGILVKTVPDYLVYSKLEGHGYRGFDIQQ